MSYHLPPSPRGQRASFIELGEGPPSIDRFVGALRAFKHAPAELARVRDVALELVRQTRAYDERGELDALFRFVRDDVRYVKDVAGIDTLQTPTATLERLQGDCDDKSLLLASLAQSIGYPSRFVVSATRKGQSYNHVYVEAWSPQLARWVALEPSVVGIPLGQALPSYEPLRRYE
jgi:transglutaminase-like putative cysteine protease